MIRSRLLWVRFCGEKWCHFQCMNLDTNERYEETGKLWYLGDAMTRSGLDITPWASTGFFRLVRKCIKFQVEIIWEMDGWGSGYIPHHLGHNQDKLEEWIVRHR